MWLLLLTWAATLLRVEPAVTKKGCACEQTWTYDTYDPCTDFCCNPDASTGGDWCQVEDSDCEGLSWGFCDVPTDTSTDTPIEPCEPFVLPSMATLESSGNDFLLDDKPFKVVAGSGCCLDDYSEGFSDYSSGDICLKEVPGQGSCIFAIAQGLGYVTVTGFQNGNMTLNGFVYNNNLVPGPYDFQPGYGFWEGQGCTSKKDGECPFQQEGWRLCARVDSGSKGQQLQPAFNVPEKDPGCQVSGDGLCVSNRRTEHRLIPCSIQVAPGTGPIIHFQRTNDAGDLIINGDDVSVMLSQIGIRPSGIITYTPRLTDQAPPGGFELCVVGQNHDQPDALGNANDQDQDQPKEHPRQMVTGVANGAGGLFDFPMGASDAEKARRACESVYNSSGGCLAGECHCFKYYYRRGSSTCDCGKTPGEYEWVYESCPLINEDDELRKYISEDYVYLLANKTRSPPPPDGIAKQDVGILVRGNPFVRYRATVGCGKFSWVVALYHLGEARDASQHLVLDLRASNYVPGSDSWTNAVPGEQAEAAQVEGVFFDDQEKAFIFGTNDRSDVITVSIQALSVVTWSLWVRIPNPVIGHLMIMEARTPYGQLNEPRYLDLAKLGRESLPGLDDAGRAPLNEWCHIAMVSENGTWPKHYLNGELQPLLTSRTDTFWTNIASAQDVVTIGVGENRFAPSTTVWISDVAIFSRELGVPEIRDLYLARRPSEVQTELTVHSRKCIFNGLPNDFAAGIATVKPSGIPFKVTSGSDCEVTEVGPCIRSHRRRLIRFIQYQSGESCKFEVASGWRYEVAEFDIGPTIPRSGDIKTSCGGLDNTREVYANASLRDEDIVPGEMSWEKPYAGCVVDHNINVRGWTICRKRNRAEFKVGLYLDCLKHNAEDALPEELQAALGPTAKSCPTSMRESSCTVSVAANVSLVHLCPSTCLGTTSVIRPDGNPGMPPDTTSSWAVISGSCSVRGSCATSPLFPLAAPVQQSCILQAPPSSLKVISPMQFGLVKVNGKSFLAQSQPLGGITPATFISWTSNRPGLGWKLCSLEAESCGENCASSATMSCGPTVQSCTDTVLQPAHSSSCHGWMSRPYAEAASCDNGLAWLQLDLGQAMKLGSVRLISCQGDQHCGRKVELSHDGHAWQTVYNQSQGYGPVETSDGIHMSFVPQSARYVRVSTGRSASNPAARFLHISLADKPCEDDESWTDRRYGNGDYKCSIFQEHPSWCYFRGSYSVEGLDACPRSCGACVPLFHPIPSGMACLQKSLLDETSMDKHVHSDLSCFRYCLLQNLCTHFEAKLGVYCRIFQGCELQQSSNELPRFFIVPARSNNAMEDKLTASTIKDVYQEVGLKETGRCVEDMANIAECADASEALGYRMDSEALGYGMDQPQEQSTTPGVCYYDASRGIVTFISALIDCTPTKKCLCRESSVTQSALVSRNTTDYFQDLLRTVDMNFSHNDESRRMCLATTQGRCRGQSRLLRQVQVPPIKLGPWAFPTPVDWNGDNHMDLLIGRGTGELIYVQSVLGKLDLATALGLPRQTLTGSACQRYWKLPDEEVCRHWCCHDNVFGNTCVDVNSTRRACQIVTSWNVTVQGPLIPVAADWDGDMQVDLIVSSCTGGLQYWKRDGEILTPVLDTNPFKNIVSDGSCVHPEVVDWDGDSDLDLLLGRASGLVDYYENSAGQLRLIRGQNNPLEGVAVEGLAAPCAVDWDGDGDTDLLVGSASGSVHFYARTVQGELLYEGLLPNIRTASNSVPRGVDWDGDGDVDLLLGNYKTGQIQVFISEEAFGYDSVSERFGSENPFSALDVGLSANPQLVDWDADGDLDLIVGTLSGKLDYFEAGADGAFRPATSESVFSNLTGLGTSVFQQAIDWDGDGAVDLLIGDDAGGLQYFEREKVTGQLKLGRSLFEHDVVFGTGPVPHAVDWDDDGDLDLLVGDSSRNRHQIQLNGFPVPQWNQWFFQQGPDMLIGGRRVFKSASGSFVLAHCTITDKWFLFHNDSINWHANVAGKCSGMLARTLNQLEELVDKYWATQSIPLWEVVVSAFISDATEAEANDDMLSHYFIESNGSPDLPHCNTCSSTRAAVECDACELTPAVAGTCAQETCQNAGFELGQLVSVIAIPLEACACVDTDSGASDHYGAACNSYTKSWCGRYDTDIFNSTRMCCTCGGGHGPVHGVQKWQVKAKCYHTSQWVRFPGAAITEISPQANLIVGHVRYFERIGSGLVERVGVDNPFVGISTNSRPFPLVIDWNRDGRNDLVIAGENDESSTVISNAARPSFFGNQAQAGEYCSWPDQGGTCVWNDEAKRTCAMAFCRFRGYSSGVFVSGFDMSKAVKTGSIDGTEDLCLQNYKQPWGHPDFRSYVINAITGAVQSGIPPQKSISLMVRCEYAGVRYYEQQRDGSMVEHAGVRLNQLQRHDITVEQRDTPLAALANPHATFVQILDFDGDNRWDMVVGGNNGALRYFKSGTPCEVISPCSGRGLCNYITGKCECKKGHAFSDCSACTDFYSSRRTPGAIAACNPCPGIGDDGGLCAGRGMCMDNAAAQANVTAAGEYSNTTITFITGSGECVCGPHFAGQDSLGRATCTEGYCPAGSELKLLQEEEVSACLPCQPGAAKQEEGNHACELCPEGYFSPDAGATACTPCTGGKFQERKGQNSCQVCLPASFSGNASSSCSACPIGRFMDQPGQSECQQCLPGRWSSAAGAEQCKACAAGKYGLGTQECQACEAGTYSKEPGTSACVLCSPGRYSAAREADSSSSCLQCDWGKFSSSRGASSQETCTDCGDGATTTQRGATDRSMCIQPAPGNFTCVAGRDCQIAITGTGLSPGSHKMAILSLVTSKRSLSPSGISSESSDGTNYQWKAPLVLSGGTYELLWCSGLQGSCTNVADFSVQLGFLELVGPVASHFMCVRGKSCERLGPVHGVGLQSTDAIQVQRTCGIGPAVSLSNTGVFDANVTFDLDLQAILFGFGSDAILANPDDFHMCWCSRQGGDCASPKDFLVSVGPLKIEGPRSGNEVTCSLGQLCGLGRIEGASAGDRLMVVESCGLPDQIIDGVPGGGVAETVDSFDFEFLPLTSQDTNKVLTASPGLYRLCFCRPSENQSSSCGGSEHFLADAGLFQAKGPYSDQTFGCNVGEQCLLEDLQGIGLEDGDELELRTSAEGTCDTLDQVDPSGKHPVGMQSAHSAAQGDGQVFSFGTIPSSAVPGKYLLCWRPGKQYSPKAFHATVGFLFVTCPAGTYRLVNQATVSCKACPVGFFCLGGAAGSLTSSRTKCDAGSTTQSSGSPSAQHCLCAPGFIREGKECVACPKGRYKSLIADGAMCPETCPNGTSSQEGASTAEHCFSLATADRANATLGKARVFALEGALRLPACLTEEKERAARLRLQRTLASLLDVLAADVQLSFPEGQCNSQGDGAVRRLTEGLQVTYKVLKSSDKEAERLLQNIEETAIQADLAEVGIAVTMAASPSITSELLDCATVGDGRSFPLGARPTSLDECTCALGNEFKNARCQPCDVGFFKGTVGELPCSYCPRVPVVESPTELVRLATLTAEAIAEDLCECPAGYYNPPGSSSPPGTCSRCGYGHYCPGARRLPCPEGSTTQAETASDIADCVCDAGYTMSFPRNETYRCIPCSSGFFKAVVGDAPCNQPCPALRNSNPGAKSSQDCFCEPGYFYLNFSDSCQPCPPDGVDCPGGFDPPDSRVHAEPMSQGGYYMTGFALAEECYTEDEDGESVCLEGATWSNQSGACAGQQTGDLCGACLHLSARDLGDEPCEECDDAIADWMHVGSLNLDLLLKAAFGIFLGKQAMDSATKTTKMEAVIIRILLQWNTASSVLASFDLSSVKLFHWSTEDAAVLSISTTATGLSFKFQFPTWFRSAWRTVTVLSASLPSPVSPQVSLECLLQRQRDENSTMPSFAQLLAPALWWLLYPVSVTFWVAVGCLLIAKVGYPFTLWLAKRARQRLRTRLSSVGVSTRSVEAVVSDAKRLKSIMSDASAMASDTALVEALGGDVFAEAGAASLVTKAGPQCLEMLQKLIDDDQIPNEENASRVKDVLAGGLTSLGPFLEVMFKSIEHEKVENVFAEPLSIPPVLCDFLKRDDANLIQGDVDSAPLATAKTADIVDSLADAVLPGADDEAFGEEAVPDVDVSKDYPIFGLFRNTAAKTVLRDAFPLYAVTMYSIWDTVTQRMLGLVQVKTILVTKFRSAYGKEQQAQVSRWLYDMRFGFLKGDHIFVGIIGFIGLSFWSIGFIAVLFATLRKGKHRLQERLFIRNYGYFYNGLEPNVYWWEVVVKKLDVLLLYIVTFTELFHDPRAKLIMYLGLAGIFWAAHNMYHPYDNRQNRLADRIEDQGLGTRFTTVLVLQILLILNAHPQVNAVMALLLVAINMRFVFTIAFVLGIEIPDVDSEEQSKELSAKAMDEMGGGASNPIIALVTRIMKMVVGYIIKPIIKVVLRMLSVLARMKKVSAEKVPHLQWQGVASDFIVVTHEKEKLPWWKRLVSGFFSHIYQLSDHQQKAFVAHAIGQFWDYVLINSDCHQLPAHLMDIFFLLPGAIKKERSEESPDHRVAFHLRVANRISDILTEDLQPSGDKKRPTRRMLASRGAFAPGSTDDLDGGRSAGSIVSKKTSFKHSEGLPDHTHSGEDLNAALLFIQRLPKSDMHELILAAEPRWPDVTVTAEPGGEGRGSQEDGIGKQFSI